MSGINLEIKANAGQAVNQLEKVASTLYEVSANTTKVSTGMASMGRATDKVGESAKKASEGLGKINTSSDKAGNALMNLGRVAQDAPFGFVGITNNINPLLESFQRLKAESGSTGNALKALAGSLMGGAGLGLAVSLITGALTVLSMNGFFKTKEATDSAAEAAKKYKEELSSIASSVGKEAANVAELISVLKSETSTREDKLEVIKKLNKINPETFKGLELEKNQVVGIDAAYKAYIATLKNVYAAKIIQARLDKEFARLVELEGAAKTKTERGNRALLNFYTGVDEKAGKASTKVGDLRVNFAQSLDPITATKGKIEELISSLSEFDNVVKVDSGKSGTEKKVKSIADVLAELERNIKALEQTEILFNVDKSRDKIKEIEGTIQTLFKDFGLKAYDKDIQDLNNRIKAIFVPLERVFNDFKPITSLQIKLDEEQAAKEIEKAAKKLPPLNVPLNVRKSEAQKEIEDFEKWLSDKNTSLAQSVSSTLGDAFGSIGESIGQSLAQGANFGEVVFGNLFKVLGAGLKELGRGMIQIGIAKTALEKFKFSPGIGTIVAGVAAIAAGALLSNIKLPGFANGVDNFSGGVAIVGERGPEIVRLPQGSDVIPNHRLNSMLPSSSNSVYIPNVTLRGSDLVVAFNRQNQTNGRNG